MIVILFKIFSASLWDRIIHPHPIDVRPGHMTFFGAGSITRVTHAASEQKVTKAFVQLHHVVFPFSGRN